MAITTSLFAPFSGIIKTVEAQYGVKISVHLNPTEQSYTIAVYNPLNGYTCKAGITKHVLESSSGIDVFMSELKLILDNPVMKPYPGYLPTKAVDADKVNSFGKKYSTWANEPKVIPNPKSKKSTKTPKNLDEMYALGTKKKGKKSSVPAPLASIYIPHMPPTQESIDKLKEYLEKEAAFYKAMKSKETLTFSGPKIESPIAWVNDEVDPIDAYDDDYHDYDDQGD